MFPNGLILRRYSKYSIVPFFTPSHLFIGRVLIFAFLPISVLAVNDYEMEKGLRSIGHAGAEKLEALAAGLREKTPGEHFCRRLVQVYSTTVSLV